MSEYTEGPWEWYYKDGIMESLQSVKEDNFGDKRSVLSYYYDTGEYFSPNYANRKLIAAAPELLEAAEEFLEIEDTWKSDEEIRGLNKLKRAVEKAKPEGDTE